MSTTQTRHGHRILQVFNRYLEHGGEEDVVNRFCVELAESHSLSNCFFDSADWKGTTAPGKLTQAIRMFYNAGSASILRSEISKSRPDLILMHNLYPVGSPSLYRTALQENIPILQFVHNFRPFSVGGTLWAKGRLCEASLRGNYLKEVSLGAWQNSVIKSALFAGLLKFLHLSGWLRSVRGWIAISHFMRDRFIEAGIDPTRVHTLHHSWTPRTRADDPVEDLGYYLFLGRLVEEKGLRVLVDAWDILSMEMGESAPVLVIAGRGDLEAYVTKAAERNPRIHYKGFVSGASKQELLRGCRAMVAPSTWWEPLGLVTYEAYDSKKPMLAAASGGLSETVIPGVTGWLHERGNPHALARDVVACEALKPIDRAAMGREGRRWLERNADPRIWTEKFNAIVAYTMDQDPC